MLNVDNKLSLVNFAVNWYKVRSSPLTTTRREFFYGIYPRTTTKQLEEIYK